MTKGVYLTKPKGKIVVISKSELYQDIRLRKFWIVTYEYGKGIFPKTLIRPRNLKHFVRIGDL
jgi:hypothetical protein